MRYFLLEVLLLCLALSWFHLQPTRDTMALTAFELGQIYAHQYHGLTVHQISKIVIKPGAPRNNNKYSHTGIGNAIAKMEEDPSWRGERKAGTGRASFFGLCPGILQRVEGPMCFSIMNSSKRAQVGNGLRPKLLTSRSLTRSWLIVARERLRWVIYSVLCLAQHTIAERY